MDSFYKAEKSKLIYALHELKRDLQTETEFAENALEFCRKEKYFEAFVALSRVTFFPKWRQERKIEIFCKRYFPEVWGDIEKWMSPGKQN